MRKYFGTDGIRGEANRELTLDLALKLGYALGYYLKKQNPNKQIKVILGTDTRVSGYMLRSALFAGLTSVGVNIDFVGVIPTPGVAYITRAKKADAGIMISASHNPAKDNGIKIFNADGYKLADDIEEEIEKIMDSYDDLATTALAGDEVGRFKYVIDEYLMYRNYLVSTVATDFRGMKIVIDSANGAAYRIAKDVFLDLGAEIVSINDVPNGHNINVKCGSTDTEILSKVVVGYQADLGLAYDGDADRLMAVDRYGTVVDGDKIIAILALNMKKQKQLNDNRVVTTVMSNMGLEKYLENNGIIMIRAGVGDRYVLEMMKKEGINIGGEQSGHVILSDYSTTGDGILTSIKLVEALKQNNASLDEMVADIEIWPQKLINIRVDNQKKNIWNKNENIVQYIKDIVDKNKDSLRVLVRTSGTEALIRVMVEGQDKDLVEKSAEDIAKVIEKELN